MGGKKVKNLYTKGIIKKYIFEIEKIDKKRTNIKIIMFKYNKKNVIIVTRY